MLIVIRKYSNRRMYSTREKAYVTLSDLLTMIQEGEEIQVLHAKTGKDLTREVLLQILFDTRGIAARIPNSHLSKLIQMEEETLQDLFQEWLPALIDQGGPAPPAPPTWYPPQPPGYPPWYPPQAGYPPQYPQPSQYPQPPPQQPPQYPQQPPPQQPPQYPPQAAPPQAGYPPQYPPAPPTYPPPGAAQYPPAGYPPPYANPYPANPHPAPPTSPPIDDFNTLREEIERLKQAAGLKPPEEPREQS